MKTKPPKSKSQFHKSFKLCRKIKEAEIKKQRVAEYVQNPRICIFCCSTISYERKNRKTCSTECKNRVVGVYHEGSSRAKSGWYNNIWCDSLYELCFLMYHIDHGIKIKRNKQTYAYVDEDGRNRTYLPDFIVNEDSLVEIKGFVREVDNRKFASVDTPLTVYAGKGENEEFIDYVRKTYKLPYSRLSELYDKTNHVHDITCTACSKIFRSGNKKSKVCSRSCSANLSRKARNLVAHDGIEPSISV